jgi:hypothetical protein
MKRLVAVSAVLVVALTAPAASAVKHNRIAMSAIGPLRLGMDQAAERKALRQLRPGSFRSYDDTDVKGGLVYREYSYYRGYGVDSYHVGFLGQRGHPRSMRVARIVTFVAADRTAVGAHVGMSEDAARRMYRSAMHCGQIIYGASRVVLYKPCPVGAASKQHIVLLMSRNVVDSVWKVDRIAAQKPGLTVPIVQ